MCATRRSWSPARKKSRKPKKGGRKRAYTQNTELNALVEQLTEQLATKVKIHGSPERGRIEIEYYSREDLERVLELITGGKMKKDAVSTQNLPARPQPTYLDPPPTTFAG